MEGKQEKAIALTDHAEGCVLPVRAQPGARKPGLMGTWNGAVKIAVGAPPEDGRANKALVEALCQILDRKRAQVELLKGQTSRDKLFLIRGLSRAEVASRFQARGIG